MKLSSKEVIQISLIEHFGGRPVRKGHYGTNKNKGKVVQCFPYDTTGN
jgi:hypothetical protein